jgi:hypothetical protein
MKKALLAALVLVPTLAIAQFAQLSGSATQYPATGDPEPVIMDQVDALNNLTVIDNTRIQVHTHGPYFVMGAGQIGSTGPRAAIRLFLRVNNLNVPNTNVLGLAGNQEKTVLVTQGIVLLNAGDELEVMLATDKPGKSGLEVIDIPGEPLVPSIITSIFKLDYASEDAVATNAKQGNSCWGQASAVFAKLGLMGEHSSSFPTPRLGIRNLARELYEQGLIPDDSMQSLGAFVAEELGLDISACY